MTAEIIEVIVKIVSLLVLLLGLTLAVLFDHFIKKNLRRIILIIAAMLLSLIVQNIGEFYFEYFVSSPLARTLFGIYGYAIRPVVIVMFVYLIGKKDKLIYIAWGLVAVNALIYLTATFSDVAFKITEANKFIRGPLGFTCHIVSGVLLAYILFLSIKECYRVKKAESAMPIFNMAIVVAGIVADAFVDTEYAIPCLTIAMVISSVFYYIWLHLQYVRDHERALAEEHRNQLLISQIQPHFIYNTLFSIQNIEGNPEETKQAITEFANYIRGNLAALDGKELIPFKSEMEYVKDYVSLQQRRFPNKYVVNYDIRDEDFSIPPLTIQILIENAMKHGIGIRYENGTITIRSRREKQSHVISIIDNGVGFDTDELKSTNRVGLRAVKNRLEYHLNGKISIESRPGVGTSVLITIPADPPPPVSDSEG